MLSVIAAALIDLCQKSVQVALFMWDINVRRCGGMYMVLLELKDHLELFVKRSEFLPGSRFLSCRDMT